MTEMPVNLLFYTFTALGNTYLNHHILAVLSPGSSEYIILIKLNLPQPVAIKNSYVHN